MRSCCQSSRAHPQDGASSWLVCVCSAIAEAITVGFSMSFGVFLPHLMKHFKTSRERTAWVASLSLSLLACLAVISGPLCGRFGCRKVTICGSLFCTASLISSSFVPRLELMYLTYGVIYGFGSSLVFTSCLLITAQYFTRWRPLAITFVVSGNGAGILAIGPTAQALIELVGWQGALQFFAGATAFVVVLSCSFDEIKQEDMNISVVTETNNTGNELGVTNTAFDQEALNNNDDVGGVRHQRTDEDVQIINVGDTVTMNGCDSKNKSVIGQRACPLDNGGLNNFKEESQANGTIEQATVTKIPISVIKGAHEEHRNKGINKKSLIDCSVWSVPVYSVTVISSIIAFLSMMNPAVHLSEYAEELSIPLNQAAKLYIYMGITSFLGRSLVGLLSVLKLIKVQWLYQLSLFGDGIASILLPHISHFSGLVGYVLVYGACNGAYMSLLYVLTIEALNEQQRPSGLGMQMCLGSVSRLIGPPLAGLIADKYGSYAPAFYAAGSVSIVAGALMLTLLCCKNLGSLYEPRKEEKHNETNTFDTKL